MGTYSIQNNFNVPIGNSNAHGASKNKKENNDDIYAMSTDS